jgi:hypothetical protein
MNKKYEQLHEIKKLCKHNLEPYQRILLAKELLLKNEPTAKQSLNLIKDLTEALSPNLQLQALLENPIALEYYLKERAINKQLGKSDRGMFIAIWSEYIKRRYKYTCALCTSTKKTQAHHIDGWAHAPNKGIDVNNGICLCETCHDEYHNQYSTTSKSTFVMFLGHRGKHLMNECKDLGELINYAQNNMITENNMVKRSQYNNRIIDSQDKITFNHERITIIAKIIQAYQAHPE